VIKIKDNKLNKKMTIIIISIIISYNMTQLIMYKYIKNNGL